VCTKVVDALNMSIDEDCGLGRRKTKYVVVVEPPRIRYYFIC